MLGDTGVVLDLGERADNLDAGYGLVHTHKEHRTIDVARVVGILWRHHDYNQLLGCCDVGCSLVGDMALSYRIGIRGPSSPSIRRIYSPLISRP